MEWYLSKHPEQSFRNPRVQDQYSTVLSFAFRGTLYVKPRSIHSAIEYLGGSTK